MFTDVLAVQGPQVGGPTLTPMRYIKERLNNNFVRMREYYQQSGGWVDSRHILIKLLDNLSDGWYHPASVYYDLITDRYDAACRAVGITTPTNRGYIPPTGSFYGRSSKEAYIAVESFVDPNRLSLDWKTQSPVKVIRNDYTSLDLHLPDNHGYSTGYAVFSIDVPVLGLMYRMWLREQLQRPEGMRGTPANFIYQYVLPGMLPSQCDVALINLVRKQVVGIDTLPIQKKQIVNLATPYTFVDKVISTYVDWATVKPRSFSGLLDTFPQVFSQNVRKTVLTGVLPTTQDKWVTTFAEIPLLETLLVLDMSTGHVANKHAEVDIQIALKRISQERLLTGIRGDDSGYVSQDLLEHISPYFSAA